jgi:hypothetical protein
MPQELDEMTEGTGNNSLEYLLLGKNAPDEAARRLADKARQANAKSSDVIRRFQSFQQPLALESLIRLDLKAFEAIKSYTRPAGTARRAASLVVRPSPIAYCRCGTKIKAGGAFCSRCGARLKHSPK